MYDLNSLLTTISAGSASFIAIIGGLIASKLIDINNQRAAVEEEMEALADRRVYIEAINDHLEDNIGRDDALDFIADHCSVFFSGVMCFQMRKIPFDETLFNDLDGSEDLENLGYYWNEAQEILIAYYSRVSFDKRMSETENASIWNAVRTDLKSRNIPEFFILGLSYLIKDMFNYVLMGRQAYAEGKRISEPGIMAKSINGYGKSAEIRNKWIDEHEKNLDEIGFIEMRLNQLDEKRKQLRQPAGIKQGFVLFGLFISFCVILPLVFVPFQTENYTLYVVAKILFIMILAAGLFGCLLYLIRMLNWGQKTKQEKRDKA